MICAHIITDNLQPQIPLIAVLLCILQADGEEEVLVAGDPERKHMALCDKLGGIPYHKNQILNAVSVILFVFEYPTF